MIDDFKINKNIPCKHTLRISYTEENRDFLNNIFEEQINRAIIQEITKNIENYFNTKSEIRHINLLENNKNIFEVFIDNYGKKIIMNNYTFDSLGWVGSSLGGNYDYNILYDLTNNYYIYKYDDIYLNVEDDGGIYDPITRKINRTFLFGYEVINPLTYIIIDENNQHNYIDVLRNSTINRILE